MKHIVNLHWRKGIHFIASTENHKLDIDAPRNVGGNDKAPAPREYLLSALGGCSGMDIKLILDKMDVEVEKFNIEVSGETSQPDNPPIVFTSITMIYRIDGEDLDMQKIVKAVELSHEKYCSIIAMMRKVCDICYHIYINNVKVSQTCNKQDCGCKDEPSMTIKRG